MRPTRLLLLPFAPLLAAGLGACSGGSYGYGPASYGAPGSGTYAPIPIPLPSPAPQALPPSAPVSSAPLPPLPGTVPGSLAEPYAAPPLEPVDAAPVLPPARDDASGAPMADPAPASGDPVTDLLLMPPGQRGAAAPAASAVPAEGAAASKGRGGGDADPFMGFRPMRGQTRPSL